MDDVGERIWQRRELARRARRLAAGLTSHTDREDLLRHAAELDAQAAELEARAWPFMAPPSPGAEVQMQAQQQQQQQSEAAHAPPSPRQGAN